MKPSGSCIRGNVVLQLSSEGNGNFPLFGDAANKNWLQHLRGRQTVVNLRLLYKQCLITVRNVAANAKKIIPEEVRRSKHWPTAFQKRARSTSSCRPDRGAR